MEKKEKEIKIFYDKMLTILQRLCDLEDVKSCNELMNIDFLKRYGMKVDPPKHNDRGWRFSPIATVY